MQNIITFAVIVATTISYRKNKAIFGVIVTNTIKNVQLKDGRNPSIDVDDFTTTHNPDLCPMTSDI